MIIILNTGRVALVVVDGQIWVLYNPTYWPEEPGMIYCHWMYGQKTTTIRFEDWLEAILYPDGYGLTW